MPNESTRLRHADLRAVYLLVGECCELGADPLIWRQHMLNRLNALLGAVATCDMEVSFDPHANGIGAKVEVGVTLDHFSDREREILTRCLSDSRLEDNPLAIDLVRRCPPGGVLTALRRQRVSDVAWDRCRFRTDFFAPVGWDDTMISIINGPGRLRCVNVSRECSDKPFPLRAPRILDLFLREITALPDTRLAPLSAESLAALPPRLREVLLALAHGDNEKQVAVQLGISRGTVHEYVRRLFGRFGVKSRGELLVRAARQVHALELATAGEGNGCWFFQRAIA